MDQINNIRQMACEEGVYDPVTRTPMSSADYKPLKWSQDLEYIARIRAAEAAVTMQHLRTNGENNFTLTSPNGVASEAELLAWGGEDFYKTINQWLKEKQDYLDQNGANTENYATLINPRYRSVALGTFCSEDANFFSTTVAEFSTDDALNESFMDFEGIPFQTLEVKTTYLYGEADLRGGTESVVGDIVPLELTIGTSFTKDSQTY